MKGFFTFFRKDWLRKISALVFAIMIYGAVRMQLQEEERFEQVRVEIETEDKGTVVLDDEEHFVSVTLKGTKRELSRIKNNNAIRVKHTVPSGTRVGPYVCILRESDVVLPPGVRLQVAKHDGITPSRIPVILDQVEEKQVPVRLNIDRDTIPPGKAIKLRTATPSSISIYGPVRYLEDVKEVATEEISFSQNAPMNDSFQIALVKPPNVMRMSKSKVDVKIQLHQLRDFRQFTSIPVQVLKKPGSRLYVKRFIDTPVVDFVVEGDRKQVMYVELTHVQPFIKLDDKYDTGKVIGTVHVWLDRERHKTCQIRRIEPKVLSFEIGVRENGVEQPSE